MRPTAMCMIEASYSFAVAWENGKVEVWRVHLQSGGSAPKYKELELVAAYQLEDESGDFVVAMTHVVSGKSWNHAHISSLSSPHFPSPFPSSPLISNCSRFELIVQKIR